jgi:hypothetical protein
MMGSNLGQYTGYSDWGLSWFSSVSLRKCQISDRTRPRRLRSTSFPVHQESCNSAQHSLATESDAEKSEDCNKGDYCSENLSFSRRKYFLPGYDAVWFGELRLQPAYFCSFFSIPFDAKYWGTTFLLNVGLPSNYTELQSRRAYAKKVSLNSPVACIPSVNSIE